MSEVQVNCFLFCFQTSPNKAEFIRAKYQMLAFVHRLPCRDDDSVTAKDLSKVGALFPVPGEPTETVATLPVVALGGRDQSLYTVQSSGGFLMQSSFFLKRSQSS